MHRSRPDPRASAPQFTRRFRLLMSYHDLTLREIAAATRCAVSTVGTWKNGRVPSAAAVRERLAEIFHVSVEYLLTGQLAEPADETDGSRTGDVASRILADLNALVQALEAGGKSSAPDGVPPIAKKGNNRRPGRRNPDNQAARQKIERYLQSYLDHAEREPGGLAHAWVQLRREFPLDLYERLK
jgi:transcriptional regulator with XRE-family HTH domain